jgi:hypothetical protein
MCRRAASLLLLGALSTSAAAFVGPKTTRVVASELTAMPAAKLAKPLRTQARIKTSVVATPAWQKLAALGTWNATWDAATAVPNRIWGSGLPAPGANGSPQIAEVFARQVLAQHVALLAPGAAARDFVLVSNHSDGDIRSVGFAQYANGLRVLGGQVSFRFKADRMFVIGSEALPHVKFDHVRTRLATPALATRAGAKLRSALDLPHATLTAPGDELILPLVGDDAVLGYRVARALVIDGGADGKYLAYVDPATGDVLAVRQQNFYVTGQLLYNVVDRNPSRPRVNRAAHTANVAVGGVAQTTSPAGMLSWPDGTVTVTTSVVGQYVTVANKADGDDSLVAADVSLSPSGQAVLDVSTDERQDAQVNVYIATNKVKDFVRTNIDPGMAAIDQPIIANVNINQACNAFFDGTSINFFKRTNQCQNTGLVEDVVFHEFGHALHMAEIIEGVGSFDGALSEGASDFLAASMTGDPGMGRGFFHNDQALRDLDPANVEATWPQDIGEIHLTGLIYGGTIWDLRKALLAAKPEAEALALVYKIYLATLRRSVNIPSSMIEALAADDDDGNLANGTPNECFIRAAYGRHGMRTATGVIAAPGSLQSSAVVVRVDLAGLSEHCTGDEVKTVHLAWKPGTTATPAAGSVEMNQVDPTRFWAQLPLAQDDVTYYQADIEFTDASHLTLPDNLADTFYTAYSGATVPLYCTSFDSDPFTEGWTTGAEDGLESPWKWGVPAGGGTDPPAAFTGSNILATNLAGDYGAKMKTFAQLPEIDVGHWSDVHLQYRRWLAVEDSHFDQAQVTVNGKRAWVNFDSNMGDSSSIHHIDREWRFHDVAISNVAFSTKLKIAFDLGTDEGLQLGGWQIDDLCVVANVNSICGDGIKSPTEQCDDGPSNANTAGACRTYCQFPACGDLVVDTNEECDDGTEGSNDCTAECIRSDTTLSGCCSGSRGAGGALALGALVGAMLFVPRRRRRT